MKTDTISNQLRWVMLLLAAAVILPTVCLLWFMNQAMRNERLAVRQKLIDVYRDKTAPLLEHLERKRVEFEQELEQTQHLDPFSFFREYCLERENADGLLIYDAQGRVLFPMPDEAPSIEDSVSFEAAWELEFSDRDYLAAANAYAAAIGEGSPAAVVMGAQTAQVRCYEKAGDFNTALSVCKALAYPEPHAEDQPAASDILRARLKVVQLCRQLDSAVFESEAEKLLADLLANSFPQPPSSEIRVFVLGELLELLNQTPPAARQRDALAKAMLIRDAESFSLKALEQFEQNQLQDTWQHKQLETLELDEPAYGMRFSVAGHAVIFITHRASIVRVLSSIAERLSDTTAAVSVFDAQNVPVFGEHKRPSEAFLTIRPSTYFDGWTLGFYFRDATVFDTAASKQSTLYLWTGLLATILVFAAGALAIRAVNHQIKMNRLKNDFIATVTHELKTPLASMRLLVDTLLEGRYEDKATVPEYLSLIARENQRLTHLIDSFLTFSRMERNKQVFELQRTASNEIAAAAVDAMQGKLTGSDWGFACRIDEPLPFVNADKDAMVTVLVNLLDNACKYTNADKQIQLYVYEQDGKVCFAVRDNGVGISLRAQKKIFNRFYQVDSRLSRRSEGCGLGLSIVSFIVEAHNGQVAVESQPGQGSTFIVKLPVTS